MGTPRRFLFSEPPEEAEPEDNAEAPRRARRRPRAEHVSHPPMMAGELDGDEESYDEVDERLPAAPKKKARKAKVSARNPKTKRTGNVDGGTLPFEITGIITGAIALLLLLSLLSYSSQDTVAGRGPSPVQNWIGPGGAFVADLITLGFGLVGFVAPLALALVAVACFRPVHRPRYVALRFGAGLIAALGVMTLLHLMLGGMQLLPFPAGGLIGALIANAGVSMLAPLGTAVATAAVTFIATLISIDRPVGGTTRSLIAQLQELIVKARDHLELWREERRLLIEEEQRLQGEMQQAQAEGEAHFEDEQQSAGPQMLDAQKKEAERRARILEKAQQRAKEKLEKKQSAASAGIANAPPPGGAVITPPMPAVRDAAPTILQSDPPWARELEEPNVIPLRQALERRAARVPEAKPPEAKHIEPAPPVVRVSAAPAEIIVDDEPPGAADLKIVERPTVDAAKLVAKAEAEEERSDSKKAFQLPPLHLLDYDAPPPIPIDEDKMRAQADKLIAKFKDFGIDGRVREVRPGPVVTTYEFVPAPGIKVSKIAALSDDIAMAMEAIHVRIVAPIPGKGAVGIEIPNEKRETVYMKEIIADPAFRRREDRLLMALGKDIEGKSYYSNLAEMPHVLIAGTTGSGKSVSVNAMICSILYRATPDEVRFLMIDPKMLELSLYEGIPHLLLPPIIDSKKAAVALKWAVAEMERRYQVMSDLGVRDIKGFNDQIINAAQKKEGEARTRVYDKDGKPLEKLPYIVVIIDEYADLLAVAGKDVEAYVMRLAQKARAAGIHVMLATQRPSVDVITGVIKANFPVRMGFRLASNHDSKTIINQQGAEKLLGRGDMLFMPPGTSNVLRVHGAFISEKELHRVVDFLKAQGTPSYDMSILAHSDEEDGEGVGDVLDEPKDARYDEAVAVVARTRKCSTSWLQRTMNLGYQRAARIVDRMEREGLVGPALNAKGDREIFVKPDQLPAGD